MESIKIKSLTKKYGDKIVFDGLNLEIPSAKITALVGGSGVGKTTLLNILAGHIVDFDGEIENLPKKSAYVFQNDRLVPNLTVKENILLVKKDADADYWLDKVGLKDARALYPNELSKGMAKRVNLARAFAYGADFMLLDEPFSNLDIVLHRVAVELFASLQSENGVTAVLVTHDLDECLTLADRTVVLSKTGVKVFENANFTPEKLKNEITLALTE